MQRDNFNANRLHFDDTIAQKAGELAERWRGLGIGLEGIENRLHLSAPERFKAVGADLRIWSTERQRLSLVGLNADVRIEPSAVALFASRTARFIDHAP